MGMRVPWRGPHWCRSERLYRERRAGPGDKAARDRGLGSSWKLQDIVLCALEQHSPSLTPRGGKLQHKIQPVSPGLCKDPAQLVSASARGMQGVPTAPGSLSGKAMCPKGWQQLLKPKWSLEVTCQSCWVGGISRAPSARHLGAHTGLSWPCPPCSSGHPLGAEGQPSSCAEGDSPQAAAPLQHSTAPRGLGAPQSPRRPLPAPSCSGCALPM